MKCSITGGNFVVLGKAIHALAKISKEVCFQSENDHLLVHAVSTSRSARGHFQFLSSFFISYQQIRNLCCKVLIKSCLMPFKDVSNLDRKVNFCNLEMQEDKLILCLHCKKDTFKTFELPTIEGEVRCVPFLTGKWTNVLVGPSRLIATAVQNFHNSIQEVTFEIQEGKLVFRNFTDDEPDQAVVMHTKLVIDLEDFSQTTIGAFTEITFGLKELRAILAFVDGGNIPLSISFNGPGRVATFSAKVNTDVTADFILSTLAELPNDFEDSNAENGVAETESTSESLKSNDALEKRMIAEMEGMGERKVPETSGEHTPPSKKYRSLFGGLLQGNVALSVLREPDEILVSASDEDEDDMMI